MGPIHLGFPPPNILFLIHTAMSSKVSHSSYGSVVDLVKPKLVFMYFPLFTLEGEKSSYYVYPFPYVRDFIHVSNKHGPPYPFIWLLGDERKILMPHLAMC